MSIVSTVFSIMGLYDDYDDQKTNRIILPILVQSRDITDEWRQIGFDYPITRELMQGLLITKTFAVFNLPPKLKIEKNTSSSLSERNFKILNSKNETVAIVDMEFYLGFKLRVSFIDSGRITCYSDDNRDLYSVKRLRG